MTEYNLEVQTLAAIKTLKAKQAAIFCEIIQQTGVDRTAFAELCAASRLFNVHDRPKISIPGIKGQLVIIAAYNVIRLQRLIERLEDGEDPRTIVLEVLSND